MHHAIPRGLISAALISAFSTLATNAAAADAPPIPIRPIQTLGVVCDGISDDAANLAAAFNAAKNHAMELYVDCPINLQIGVDIAKTIFIDHGVKVTFGPSGLIITDSVFTPTFAIVNSNDVTLLNWRVKYVGSLPADWKTGYYLNNGDRVETKPEDNKAPAAYKFNDIRLAAWMRANRGMVYAKTTPRWANPTNSSTVFYVKGSTSNLIVRNMKLFVPPGAKASHFIPVAFSLNPGERSNQTLTPEMPFTAEYYAQPSNLEFTDIDLDGTYMGWVGTTKNATFTNIRSHRYADLEDDNGQNVGGVDDWFAPPHLFYIGAGGATGTMADENITITDVIDYGVRLGVARQTPGEAPSGNAASLKVGGKNLVVDNYQSYRPDGFLDLLTSDLARISNVKATCDTAFLHNLYSCVRFPSVPYVNVTMENIHLVDKAPKTVVEPVRSFRSDYERNKINMFNTWSNFKVSMNEWGGPYGIDSLQRSAQAIGEKTNTKIDFSLRNAVGKPMTVSNGMLNEMVLSLAADPSAIVAGQSTTLTFLGSQAVGCTLQGNLTGEGNVTVPIYSSSSGKVITIRAAGDYEYTVKCGTQTDPSTTTTVSATVRVTPF